MEVMVRAPGGFGLIGGASGLARMADLTDYDRQRVVDSLAELEDQTDVILIDTGAGISPNVLSFTRAADQVSGGNTPEPTAIADAYAVIKVLSARAQAGADQSAGQSGPQRAPEAKVVYQRIASVARQFLSVHGAGRRICASDPQVQAAVRRRTPFCWPAAMPASAVHQRGGDAGWSAGSWRRSQGCRAGFSTV
jgi:flagellar biosynthesis protein FlhG